MVIMDKNKEEIQRLVSNQKALLECMPEMVCLSKGQESIEYMNPSAIRFFGDLCAPDLQEDASLIQMRESIFSTMRDFLASPPKEGLKEAAINSSYIEYSIAPFVGYRGDHLYWLIMRDVTQRKKHEEELTAFHSNIESILSHKINELKQSERVRIKLSKELNSLKDHIENQAPGGEMVGSSQGMREMRDMVFQVAKTDTTILITGESGTGKELVANLIRETSHRKDQPFLKINCNNINDSLLASDLFGYEKGAFTGATNRRKGKIAVVDGGTIFLDEIGDISPRMQGSLLRVLQNGEIIRVGGNTPIKVNVRIIAATNADLSKCVQEGTFRLDLYYRLNIINILIPPLRERKEDIVDLVTHFIKHYRQVFKKDINFLPKSIINRLLNHEWPGNVRELENVIQRAILMAKSNIITEQELFFDLPLEEKEDISPGSLYKKLEGLPLKNMLSEMEKDLLTHALQKYQGNVAKTAQVLKVGKTAFYDKIKRYNINPKEFK